MHDSPMFKKVTMVRDVIERTESDQHVKGHAETWYRAPVEGRGRQALTHRHTHSKELLSMQNACLHWMLLLESLESQHWQGNGRQAGLAGEPEEQINQTHELELSIISSLLARDTSKGHYLKSIMQASLHCCLTTQGELPQNPVGRFGSQEQCGV